MAVLKTFNPAQIAAMALIGAIILVIIVALAPHATSIASSMTGGTQNVDLMSYDD